MHNAQLNSRSSGRIAVLRTALLSLFILSVSFSDCFAQFSATTSQSTVAVGDQFQITFTIEGGGKNFQSPTFTDFNLVMGPNQSTSMQFINGSFSQSQSFTYVLQAVKEGTFTIGPASIESGGKKVQSNNLTITVVKGSAPQTRQGGGSQQGGDETVLQGGKNVFLRANVDKTNVYRGEGIVVSYKLYTKVSLVNYTINKLPSFDGFFSQDIQTAQQLEFHQENIEGVAYKVADIKKVVLFPQRTGILTLDPMEGEVIARVQVNRKQQSRDPFDQFFNDPFFNNPFFNNSVQDVRVALKSEPVRITVHDLPSGAPETFTGAVGKFSMEAGLDRNETKSNDAVTLKIKVTGKGNLKLIDAPKVSYPGDFEFYDPKVNMNINATTGGVTGSKSFEYVLIPRNPGEYKIPVGGFSYFDLEKKQYVNIPGSDFMLKVTKGAESAAATVTGVAKSDIQFLGKDIRFIKTAEPAFVQGNRLLYNSPLFYSMMAAPALLLAFLLVYRKRTEEMQSNITLMKSRRANKVAKRRLVSARKLLDQNHKEAFLDEMFRALWGFISDKLQIPVSDLSKENIAQSLASRNVSAESTQQFIETLDACELARFAPGIAAAHADIYQKGIAVISKLEEEIK